jgi:hypothetical protein
MLALARRFDFERDAFTFPNELVWEYYFDAASGQTRAVRRRPAPRYALRCFVLVRAARQFFYHARFEPAEAPAYDPNDPERPARLTYDRERRTFSLPANRYWRGGALNVFEIFRRWYL